MKKILAGLAVALITFSAMAGNHDSDSADLHAAIEAFDDAYATNDVETYFSFYADGATVFFFGARVDVSAYHDEWQKIDGKWKIISLHYSEFTPEE